MSGEAKVELARLYENTSARSGKTYFVGYLGKAKVLMLKDEKTAEGHPTWVLFLCERPEKRTDAEKSAPQGNRDRQRNGEVSGRGAVQ